MFSLFKSIPDSDSNIEKYNKKNNGQEKDKFENNIENKTKDEFEDYLSKNNISKFVEEHSVSELSQLSAYPQKNKKIAKKDYVFCGDQHSSPLAFLHALIKRGAIKLKEKYYDKLVDIYKKFPEDIEEFCKNKKSKEVKKEIATLIKDFSDNLKHIKISKTFVKKKRQLFFTGDLWFADRGKNDYLTLLAAQTVLGKLATAEAEEKIKKKETEKKGKENIINEKVTEKKEEVPEEINAIKFTVGNHELAFFHYLLGMDISIAPIYPNDSNSLQQLKNLLALNIVTEQEIRAFFENYYAPNAHLIKCFPQTENHPLTYCVHAPTGIRQLKDIEDSLLDFTPPKKYTKPKIIENYFENKGIDVVDTVNFIDDKFTSALKDLKNYYGQSKKYFKKYPFMQEVLINSGASQKITPLFQAFWQRYFDQGGASSIYEYYKNKNTTTIVNNELLTKKKNNGVTLLCINGHDKDKNNVSLTVNPFVTMHSNDSDLGKTPNFSFNGDKNSYLDEKGHFCCSYLQELPTLSESVSKLNKKYHDKSKGEEKAENLNKNIKKNEKEKPENNSVIEPLNLFLTKEVLESKGQREKLIKRLEFIKEKKILGLELKWKKMQNTLTPQEKRLSHEYKNVKILYRLLVLLHQECGKKNTKKSNVKEKIEDNKEKNSKKPGKLVPFLSELLIYSSAPDKLDSEKQKNIAKLFSALDEKDQKKVGEIFAKSMESMNALHKKVTNNSQVMSETSTEISFVDAMKGVMDSLTDGPVNKNSKETFKKNPFLFAWKYAQEDVNANLKVKK